MRNENLLEEIASGKEVYFENTFEEVAFRNIIEGGYEARNKGGFTYKLLNVPNKLVDACLEGKMLTKEEYENY
jgi:hypothetical protein